jgi:glucokinase
MRIGVDLGGTNLRAGLLKNERILKQESIVLINKHQLESTLDQVCSTIKRLITPEVEGIGIGVPSVVDSSRGIVYNVANIPSWEEVPIKDILEEKFDVPVHVNNDVNCFILGEHGFGQVRDFQNVVGIAIGTGLGGGIIIDNKLYCGTNCGAGEFGLLPYRDHNIEYYCSGNFFEVFHNTSASEVYNAAKDGNVKALEIWEEFGAHLGEALMAVLYSYDPDAVIFGGSISQAHEYFGNAMLARLRKFDYPESIKKLKVFYSNTPGINLLGAAALVNPYTSILSR